MQGAADQGHARASFVALAGRTELRGPEDLAGTAIKEISRLHLGRLHPLDMCGNNCGCLPPIVEDIFHVLWHHNRGARLAPAIILGFTGLAQAQLVTQDLTQGVTPADLVSTLVGPGVAVTNIQFSGDNVAAGKVSGGTGIIGFANGIILSSGCISNVIPAGGLNTASDVTCDNQQPGDPDLDALIPGYETLDRCVLRIRLRVSEHSSHFVPIRLFVGGIQRVGQYLFQRCLRVFRQRRQRRAAA